MKFKNLSNLRRRKCDAFGARRLFFDDRSSSDKNVCIFQDRKWTREKKTCRMHYPPGERALAFFACLHCTDSGLRTKKLLLCFWLCPSSCQFQYIVKNYVFLQFGESFFFLECPCCRWRRVALPQSLVFILIFDVWSRREGRLDRLWILPHSLRPPSRVGKMYRGSSTAKLLK